MRLDLSKRFPLVLFERDVVAQERRDRVFARRPNPRIEPDPAAGGLASRRSRI
jgi:hypothetical protein